MADFLLTDSGDLVFAAPVKSDRLNVKFYIAEYPGLRVSFFSRPYTKRASKSGYQISFNTETAGDAEAYNASIVDGSDETVQLTKIRLRTEVGELLNSSAIGSKLSTMKHLPFTLANLKSIESMIVFAISDILPGADVVATVANGTGNFYCQNLNVTIYQNGNYIYEFTI